MHKLEYVLENITHKIVLDFKIQTNHLILTRRPELVLISKKIKSCYLVDFAFSVNHRVKIKESEKINKFLDLAREEKQWNMKVTVIPIIVYALGIVPEA